MTHFIHIKPRYPMKTQYQDLDCVMSFFNFPLITKTRCLHWLDCLSELKCHLIAWINKFCYSNPDNKSKTRARQTIPAIRPMLSIRNNPLYTDWGWDGDRWRTFSQLVSLYRWGLQLTITSSSLPCLNTN